MATPKGEATAPIGRRCLLAAKEVWALTVKLVAVRLDDRNRITHFKTDDDRVISFAEAKKFVSEDAVDSLTDIYADGRWKIDLPHSHEEGANLGNLPQF